MQTHCVSVDHLSDRDVDNGLGDGDQVRVLIHVKLLFQRWNVTRCQKETPASEDKGKEKNIRQYIVNLNSLIDGGFFNLIN